MTQDEIIRMVREACNPQSVDPIMGEMATFTLTELERFAALVAQNYMAKACEGCVVKQCYKRMDAEIEVAVLAEREACAKMCEQLDKESCDWVDTMAIHCAKAIRARGLTKSNKGE